MADEQLKREMALFRFSLIAPVVAGTFKQASKMDYYRETSAKEHLLPNGKLVAEGYMKETDASVDTVYRYLKAADLPDCFH